MKSFVPSSSFLRPFPTLLFSTCHQQQRHHDSIATPQVTYVSVLQSSVCEEFGNGEEEPRLQSTHANATQQDSTVVKHHQWPLPPQPSLKLSPSSCSTTSPRVHDSHASPKEPPPWFNATRHAASQLTRRITACRTWQELAQLHQQHASELDFIHLSAMLSHLARLVAEDTTWNAGGSADGTRVAAAGTEPSTSVGASAQTIPLNTSSTISPSSPSLGRSPLLPYTPPPNTTSSPIASDHNHPLPAHPSRQEHAVSLSDYPSDPLPPPWSSPSSPSGASSLNTVDNADSLRLDPPPSNPSLNLCPHPMHLALTVQQQVLAASVELRPREAANCLWALARLQQYFNASQPGESNSFASSALPQVSLKSHLMAQ